MVLCSERTARCLGVILLGLALICFCVNILLFFPNGDPRYAKSNISGTVWYLSGVLGSGLLMIFPAYVFLVLWDDKGCKDCCADFRCGECDCCRDCQPCACCQSLQCPKCGDCQPCACCQSLQCPKCRDCQPCADCQSLQCPKCRDCQPCACCEDIHCPNCQECQPCKSFENCQCPPCRDCQPCRFCKDCECLRCRDCQLCKPCQVCECPRCQDCDPIRACQECECKRLCECKPCQACECPDCRTCRQACDCRQCPEFPCCDWKQCKCPGSCTCPNLCENCQCQCQSQCMNSTCTWNNVLCSIIFTVIGLIGSAYCFIVSSVALDLGPFCRVTPLGEWKHPFHKGNYLNDPNLWVKCLEPENAIPWHVKLFSILLVVSAVQFIICVALLINILIGVICKEWNCFKGYGSI